MAMSAVVEMENPFKDGMPSAATEALSPTQAAWLLYAKMRDCENWDLIHDPTQWKWTRAGFNNLVKWWEILFFPSMVLKISPSVRRVVFPLCGVNMKTLHEHENPPVVRGGFSCSWSV